MRKIHKAILVLLWISVSAFILTACGHRCEVDNCKNKAVSEHDYCEVHTCAVDGCYELITNGSLYCNEHTCSKAGCAEMTADNSTFCKEHTCCVPNCSSETKKDSPYCSIHGCKKSSCKKPHAESCVCCEEHTCITDGCKNGVKDACTHCSIHSCANANCDNPRVDGGVCCKEHTCTTSGCINAKNAGSEYCSTHQEQMERQAAESAASRLRGEYDKIEGISWYFSNNQPYYGNTRSYVFPYLGMTEVNGVKNYWLRIQYRYTGNSWVFFDHIIISVDGKKYTKNWDYFDITRDNGYGVVWEYIDVVPSSSDMIMLEEIADSSETIVRFEGDDYHWDISLSTADKSGIKDILTFYNYVSTH